MPIDNRHTEIKHTGTTLLTTTNHKQHTQQFWFVFFGSGNFTFD